MSNLTPFTYGTHEVRTITRDGEPWFVLADLCKVLDLSAPHMVAKRIADDMKGRSLISTLGGSQEMTIVSEAGMYAVIMRSDKPESEPFRRWVTSEVLPTIRKTGGYGVQKQLTGRELMAAALIEAQATLEAASKELEAARPKAHAWDTWLSTNADYSVGEIAKALHKAGAASLELSDRGDRSMGQNNLMAWLRENDWVGLRDNAPLQRRITQSYMTVKIGGYVHQKSGESVGTTTPRITAKGAARLATIFGVAPEAVMQNLNTEGDEA